jgi:hypothetical protein
LCLKPGRFTPGEGNLGTLWLGGWVDPRIGLEAVAKKKKKNNNNLFAPSDNGISVIQPIA